METARKFITANRAVARTLIGEGGGGGVYSYNYSGSARLDFKRSLSGRTRIYEYTPPPPPISVLATALTAKLSIRKLGSSCLLSANNAINSK